MKTPGHSLLGAGLFLLLGSIGSSWAQAAAETPAMQDHTAHQLAAIDSSATQDHTAHQQAAMDSSAMQDHSAHQLAAIDSSATHDHAAHQLAAMDSSATQDHSAHLAAMANPSYSVSTVKYAIPDVQLIDESGAPVTLRALLEPGHPIALNFIFTTCTTICPVMTATFAQMRRELGEAGAGIRLVSISIDPEYDRPEKLKAYAELFQAGPGWAFLTGDEADISEVLQNFNALTGSKTNHKPLTLLKRPQSPSWIRIDGLASGSDLAQEVTARLLN
jgi:protein SCO1/2